MKIIATDFEGLFIIKPTIFIDERGLFFESFNQTALADKISSVNFLQDNQSVSKKNVLRGLHFQNPPYAQAKLVRVIKGAVIDVVVDIRKKSTTYGKHFKIQLDEINNDMLFVPEGFAHGFLSLEDNTIFSYKCTNVYNKQSEAALKWNDATLNISWPINNPFLSPKDMEATDFKDFISLF